MKHDENCYCELCQLKIRLNLYSLISNIGYDYINMIKLPDYPTEIKEFFYYLLNNKLKKRDKSKKLETKV